MSLDPPTVLASIQGSVRSRVVTIPWQSLARSGILSEEHYTRITAIEKGKRDTRQQTVDNDLDGYRALFLGAPGKPSIFETASKNPNVVQYMLVFLSDLLDGKNCSFLFTSQVTTAHPGFSEAKPVALAFPGSRIDGFGCWYLSPRTVDRKADSIPS